jgi:hypothetical protein
MLLGRMQKPAQVHRQAILCGAFMSFNVGQKVVYVGGPNLPREWTPPQIKAGSLYLKKGAIYTIREIDPIYIRQFGMVGIRVEEVVFPLVPWLDDMFEIATLACKFRPIVERKTDISIFTAMLTPNCIVKINEKQG